jgi:hypothetical protein
MVMSFNGGAEPKPADLDCLKKQVKPEELDAVMKAASSGGSPDAKALAPILKGIFQCKPEGVTKSLGQSINKDGKMGDVTDTEKECIAGGLIDLFATDGTVLDAFVASSGDSANMTADMKKNITTKIEPTVTKCIADPAKRTKVLENINN